MTIRSLYHIRDVTEARNLLDLGADMFAEDTYGYSILHTGAYLCRAELVEFFISRGLCPDTKDIDGVTPLMIAAERGCLTVVQTLIKAGASVSAVDIFCEDAFTRAYRIKNLKLFSVIAIVLHKMGLLAKANSIPCKNCAVIFISFMPPARGIPSFWTFQKKGLFDFSRIYTGLTPSDKQTKIIAVGLDGTSSILSAVDGSPVAVPV